MRNKGFLILLIALVLFIGICSLVGYIQSKSYKEDKGTVTLLINVLNKTESRVYEFENISALDLLEKDNAVNTTLFSFGIFINCINGVCSNGNHHWLYYINRESASVGASQYKLKNGDIIEFRYGQLE